MCTKRNFWSAKYFLAAGVLISSMISGLTFATRLASATTTGGYLVVTGPQRVEDSRITTVNHFGPQKVRPGGPIYVALGGQGGLPSPISASATAVLLNLTVTDGESEGYIAAIDALYNSGIMPPNISNINFKTGETRANLVVVPFQPSLGNNGIRIYANANVHVIVDAIGYYTADALGAQTSGTFQPVTPFRFFDTRPETSVAAYVNGFSGILPSNNFLAADADAALATVGVTSADAIVLNVTGVGASSPTFVTAFSDDETDVPEASSINFEPGDVTSNLVVVPIGNSGLVDFYTHKATHLVADVVGLIRGPGAVHTDGRFVALSTTRILDTRDGSGVQGAGTLIFAPGAYTFAVRGQGPVPSSSIVGTMVSNVTVVSETDTFVRLWSPDVAQPSTSNINALANRPTPNAVWGTLGASGGSSTYFNGSGRLIVDISGYFTAS